MASESWIDHWRRRPSEFGALREYDDGRPIVVMEFEPKGHGKDGEWEQLRSLWLDLPRHPNVLDAIDRGSAGKLMLQ